jgi:serpin B
MGIALTDKADFNNITDEKLKINDVLHQSFIDTNEEGTEAAAVSGMAAGAGMLPLVEVILDRPFLYFISEFSTATILFMGRVGDPTKN